MPLLARRVINWESYKSYGVWLVRITCVGGLACGCAHAHLCRVRACFSCVCEMWRETHTHAHIHTHTQTRAHTHTHAPMHTHTRARARAHAPIHKCANTHTHACMNASTHVQVASDNDLGYQGARLVFGACVVGRVPSGQVRMHAAGKHSSSSSDATGATSSTSSSSSSNAAAASQTCLRRSGLTRLDLSSNHLVPPGSVVTSQSKSKNRIPTVESVPSPYLIVTVFECSSSFIHA